MSEEKTYMIVECIDEGLVGSYHFATTEDPFQFILKYWDEVSSHFKGCFKTWKDYAVEHMKENGLEKPNEDTIAYIIKESRIDGDSAAGYDFKRIRINRD